MIDKILIDYRNDINFRHFNGDSIRNVENGFTTFRCSSNGESGVISRYGKPLQRRYTGMNPAQPGIVFQVPIQTHINTMYTSIGFIFEYIIAIIAIFFILFISLIEYLLLFHKTWNNVPIFIQSFISVFIHEDLFQVLQREHHRNNSGSSEPLTYGAV